MDGNITSLNQTIGSLNFNGELLEGYTSAYNQDMITCAQTLLKSAGEKIGQIKSIMAELAVVQSDIAGAIHRIEDRIESLKDEFAEIKRQIGNTELDLDSYSTMKTGLEDAKGKIKELKAKESSKEKLKSDFRAALRERNEILMREFQAYEAEVKAINECQPELSVDILFKGDKEHFKNSIKSAFKGTSIKDVKYQSLAELFSDFAALIEDVFVCGGEKCKTVLSDTDYGKVYDKLCEKYASLLSQTTPNRVEIKYHGKLLKQHSLGQRASALVLFILTQSDNDVVIIDQPEDDLDNKVIYDEVITAIRRKKTDIQFLFATHNANIPVLGDAEKIVVADYQEGMINATQGNIDSPETHKLIVDIMEGGQEAFHRRQLIYTAWK